MGMVFGATDNVCVKYNKVRHDNPILKSDEAMEEAFKTIDESALKYRLKDIFIISSNN